MKLRKEGITRAVEILVIMLVVFMILGSFIEITYKDIKNNTRMNEIENQLKEKSENENQILEHLKSIKQQQEEIRKIEQERLDLEKKRVLSISNLKNIGFSEYTDLASNAHLTAEDMNKIINKWDKYVKDGTRFKGRGATFVKAAELTGLNPIYLFAHAAEESRWGNSYIAMTKNNYFGINCVDSNPDAGYVMGDDIDEGIIKGSVWVKVNFYDRGYVTLQDMFNANYASNKDWASNITNIANTSIRML